MRAGDEVVEIVDVLGAGVAKALLGKAALSENELPFCHRLDRLARHLTELGHDDGMRHAAHVRTIIRAITRADAAIIDLQVQAFLVMQRCADGANHFTRRIFALHALAPSLVEHFGIYGRSAKISVHANPVHHASPRDFLFADDGNVIFRLASNCAGVTADARAQINRHAPTIAVVLKSLWIEKRVVFRRRFGIVLYEIRIFLKHVKPALAQNLSVFRINRVLCLRR